jgi:hypothetical protein
MRGLSFSVLAVLVVVVVVLAVVLNRRSRCSGDPRIGAFLRKLKTHTYKLVSVLDPTDPRTEKIKHNWSGKLGEMEHEENRRAFAYNLNKGRYIAVCLHDQKGNLNSFNETFFVVMHELAHVATERYAHDRDFWDTFRWLIRSAARAGLYNNIDYKERPVTFCEYKLDENPTF